MATVDPIKAVLDARNSATTLAASAGSSLSAVTVTGSALGNLDGGKADTAFGGLPTVDGGDI